MDEDISLQELQELRDRGMVPKASKELIDFWNELMQLVYRVHDQAENLARTYRNMEAYEVGGLFEQLSNELENFFVRGKQLDLEHPYDFEELNNFYKIFYDYVNNDLMHYTRFLQDRDGFTDNVEENVKYLVYAGDEFHNAIERESYRNEQLMNNLEKVESVQGQAPQFDKTQQKIEKPEDRIKRDDYPSFWDGVQAILSKYEDKKEQKTADKNPADDKRKLPEEQVKADNRRSTPSVDSVKKAIQKYTDAVERKSFKDTSRSFVELANEINAAAKAGVISNAVADELRRPLREVQSGAFSVHLHEDAVKSLNEIVNKGQMPQQRPEKAKDIVQSVADDKRKLDYEMQQQDKIADKQGKKTVMSEPEKTKDPKAKFGMFNMGRSVEKDLREEFSGKMQEFIDNYRKALDGENVGEANYEIDKFTKYISSSARDGVISQSMANQYKQLLSGQYGKSEHDKDKFIADFKAIGKKREEKTEQQRDMTAKDIVQSPADNKREFEEELREAQQIGMVSKPKAMLYKGVYNAAEKIVSFDEKLTNDIEKATYKTNKFKDGIINVLNKRDAERAAHEQEKKENKEKQEKLFIKKMFGKGIIND